MSEPEPPADRPSSADRTLLPPPEWGKERSPVVRTIVTVAVLAACVIVAAGVAIWGFGVLGAEDGTTTRDRPNTVDNAEVTLPSTATKRGANEANVGDCVKVVKGGVNAALEVVECGAAEARYKVALEPELSEKCPAGPYLEYATVGPGGWSLCLALNATAGQCYKNSVTDGFTLTDCAAADFAVVAVLADRADKAACPPPPPNVLFHPEPLVYPTPPLTICFAGVT